MVKFHLKSFLALAASTLPILVNVAGERNRKILNRHRIRSVLSRHPGSDTSIWKNVNINSKASSPMMTARQHPLLGKKNQLRGRGDHVEMKLRNVFSGLPSLSDIKMPSFSDISNTLGNTACGALGDEAGSLCSCALKLTDLIDNNEPEDVKNSLQGLTNCITEAIGGDGADCIKPILNDVTETIFNVIQEQEIKKSLILTMLQNLSGCVDSVLNLDFLNGIIENVDSSTNNGQDEVQATSQEDISESLPEGTEENAEDVYADQATSEEDMSESLQGYTEGDGEDVYVNGEAETSRRYLYGAIGGLCDTLPEEAKGICECALAFAENQDVTAFPGCILESNIGNGDCIVPFLKHVAGLVSGEITDPKEILCFVEDLSNCNLFGDFDLSSAFGTVKALPVVSGLYPTCPSA